MSKFAKIKFLQCFLMLILVTSYDTLEIHVRGSGPLVVPLGGSVVLPCSVDSLLPLEDLKVEWTRTDSETLVHLFQYGDIRPEAQHQDYHDRAHFFTEDIKHGNFSLLLNHVREEDKGIYRCKVYSGQAADKTFVEIKDVEYFIVSGSSQSISAYVGEDVTLSCSVDSHIKPEEIEEVSWRKTDKDIPVLLYQSNETQPGLERYIDRVEFFTDEIHRGNFSLRLKRVTTEDKGVYICQVFTGPLSANTTVILETLGFSSLHIMVLILCITACGSALLFCSLTYCTLNNKGIKVLLHVCLHFCPNIMMLLASVFWYAAEGSLFETVSCCTLYTLRPLRLFWVTPHISDFPDKIINCIKSSHDDQYFPAVMVAMYSALLAEHFKVIDTITVVFICVSPVLLCLNFVIHLDKCCVKLLSAFGELCQLKINEIIKRIAACCFYLLPSAQVSLFFYPLVGFWTVFIAAVLPVLAGLCFLNCNCIGTKRTQQCSFFYLGKVVWILMCLVGVWMVYAYIYFLRNKGGYVGLFCMAGFLQALWVNTFSKVPVNYSKPWNKNVLFLFGSVGLVIVNSVALMTNLIFKAVNGKHLVEDQRIVVFPSECLFTVPLLMLPIFTPWTAVRSESQEDSQNSPDFDGTYGEKWTPFTQNHAEERRIF